MLRITVVCVVFASVGGLYFFLRTSLNAFIKCVRVVVLISFKYMKRLTAKLKSSSSVNNGTTYFPLPSPTTPTVATATEKPRDRVSLLASLPDDYLSASTTFKEQTAIRMNDTKIS